MTFDLSSAFAKAAEESESRGSLEDIFEEEPVPFNVFLKDKKYLGQRTMELSDIQYEALRHIERIYYPDLYPVMAKEFNSEYWAEPYPMRNLVTIQWAKGSGKDSVVRWAVLRVAYLLLCMKSPQEYFGMPDIDSIHMLNVASSSTQARTAFFKPMTNAVKRGWFSDKADPKQNVIEFDKNVEAISGHSEAESQEGLNLIVGVADEIDAFKTKEEMYLGGRSREASTSAETILELLKTSANTRFPETYKRVTISYPRYLGSTIQKLTKQGRDSNEKYGDSSIHFVSGPYATWEVNPRVTGKEKFAEDYATDPEGAAAKYECKPSRATNPYFKNMGIFRQSVTSNDNPITITYGIKEVQSEITGEVTEVWDAQFHFADDFRAKQGALYVMHADLAIRGDKAGIALAHTSKHIERTTHMVGDDGAQYEETLTLPEITVDFVTSFSADLTEAPPREIQIRWARELAFALIRRGFNLVRFTFDLYQSADSMQILERHGIETDRVSMDINENGWKTLRDVASDNRLKMPFDQELFDELEALSKSGKKVDHPPHGCFVGETRIPLLDGTFPQISELDGKDTWVYSSTPEGKIVPGRARGRFTKNVTELVDVILDSGYVARCTPEHLWMLRDGTYKEAQELLPGIDRLMPITFNWPVNGGYTRLTNRDGVRTLAHRMVAEYMAGRECSGDEIVHHLNEVKTDNRPDNLQIMTKAEHTSHHGDQYWSSKEYKMRQGYAEWIADEEKKKEVYSSRSMPNYRYDVSLEAILQTIREGSETRADSARRLGCDWNVVNKRLKSENLTFEEAVKSVDQNHKVRAVVPVRLETPVPVYDLEVDTWDNFALSGGVFVHNSKDKADALAGAVLGAIEAGGSETSDGSIVKLGSFDMDYFGTFDSPGGLLENFGDSSLMGNPLGMEGDFLYG